MDQPAIVYVKGARLSFPHLVEKRAFKDKPDSKPRFSADLIVDPNGPDFQNVINSAMTAATEEFKQFTEQVVAAINNDKRMRFYGYGQEKVNGQTYTIYPGYENMAYFSTSGPFQGDQRPQIIRIDGTPADTEMECVELARKLYGGCYVNAAVRVWVQNNTYGKGLRCDLIAIQFDRDGEPLGEGGQVDLTGVFGQSTQQTPSTVSGADVPMGATGPQNANQQPPPNQQGFQPPPQNFQQPPPNQQGFPPPQQQPNQQGFPPPQQQPNQQGFPPPGVPNFLK